MNPTRRSLIAALVCFPLARLVGRGPEVERGRGWNVIEHAPGSSLEEARGRLFFVLQDEVAGPCRL